MSLSDPRTAFSNDKSFVLGPRKVTKDEIIEFAGEYDPIFFHLDEEEAKASMLAGLTASGFHTCAMLMRMICDSFLTESTCQGAPKVEHVKWLSPVRPGDELSGTSTVLESRQSGSKPDLWITKFNHTLQNQRGEAVIEMIVIVLFKIPGDVQ